MKRSAVRARERREKDREDQRYNETLKEYVKFKYSHIIDEFGPFYEGLKARYPKDMAYVNTNEFRRWRKNQIQISFGNVQVAYFDKVDLHGEKTSEEDSEQEQYEQQHSEQHGEQQQQQSEQHGEQEQHEQQQSEQHDEQQHLEQQVEQHSEQHDIWQQQQQQIEQADDEINQIINELENGGVPLQNNNNDDDEGIHLDLYDELQCDIEEFDYRLEAELGDW